MRGWRAPHQISAVAGDGIRYTGADMLYSTGGLELDFVDSLTGIEINDLRSSGEDIAVLLYQRLTDNSGYETSPAHIFVCRVGSDFQRLFLVPLGMNWHSVKLVIAKADGTFTADPTGTASQIIVCLSYTEY